MFELFYMGGPLFMSILTLVFIGNVAWIFYHTIQALRQPDNLEKSLELLSYGKSIGTFALVTGILGQLIGLYSAFVAIESMGDVSPALVYGGIKVSMITTLYGVFIFLISLLLWFLANLYIRSGNKA